MRSNCVKWAHQEYWRRHQRWVEAGRVPGAEPYIVIRPTRLRIEPRWWFPAWLCLWVTDRIPHTLVGTPSYFGDLTMESYKPSDKAYALSPWRALRVLAFPGHVVAHDWPATETQHPLE